MDRDHSNIEVGSSRTIGGKASNEVAQVTCYHMSKTWAAVIGAPYAIVADGIDNRGHRITGIRGINYNFNYRAAILNCLGQSAPLFMEM